MTTRGIWKETGYWNNVEARKDWNKLAITASEAGHTELAEQYKPALSAGWRTIDKCIAKLRDALEKMQS
jgi:hypothetical protein